MLCRICSRTIGTPPCGEPRSDRLHCLVDLVRREDGNNGTMFRQRFSRPEAGLSELGDGSGPSGARNVFLQDDVCPTRFELLLAHLVAAVIYAFVVTASA